MDNETYGVADWFLVRHTTDPALQLLSQFISNRESSLTHRPTWRPIENAETTVNTTALPTNTSSSCTLTGNSRENLTEAATNSLPALDLRVPITSQSQSAFVSGAQWNPTAEYLGVNWPPVAFPRCMSDHIVESMESTSNSRLAEVQGIARATAKMHRVMQEREEREQR